MTSLRDALEAVRIRHGSLTPALVVQDARDEASPLHDLVFDRPVEEAAERYYLNRARELIRSVRVQYERRDGTPTQLREYVSVHRETGYVYEPIEEVRQDPIAREIVLRAMHREWLALKRQYETYAEFWDLVQEAQAGRG